MIHHKYKYVTILNFKLDCSNSKTIWSFKKETKYCHNPCYAGLFKDLYMVMAVGIMDFCISQYYRWSKKAFEGNMSDEEDIEGCP